MNRCQFALVSRTPGWWLAWLAATVLIGVSQAHAQLAVRQFPESAKRGNLTVTAPPQVLINGVTERLAPGARILGPNNMLVMSGSLVGQTVLVNYVMEKQGLVQQVWILNPLEAQEQRSGLETVTNFIFGSSADKPKTDDGKTPFDQLPKYPKQ